MQTVLIFIWTRVKEPSTWAGLSGTLAAMATQLPPELATVCVTGSALSGALAFALKEKSNGAGQ